MKLLMVQLPTSHLGAGEKVYPLGLARLSSLVPEEIEKQGLDMNLCLDCWVDLHQTLKDYEPDIVVMSFRNLDPLAGHQASYLSSLKTAAAVARQLSPACRILAGGPAFSLFAQRLMEEVTEIDYGIAGEGEQVFSYLLAGDVDAATIPGLLWRKGEIIQKNKPSHRMVLDDLPPLDTKTFPPSDYAGINSYVAGMGIEGKRGCDLWCGYCLYPFLGGNKMRLRHPKKVVDEMQMLKESFGISLFHFTDGVLNRPADHFEAICRELNERKLGVSWTGFFREDALSEKSLEAAMQAGLAAIYFSADALTNDGLKLLNKHLVQEDILRAAQITADAGMLTMCHFLVNLPGETAESARESEEMLDRLLQIHDPVGNLGAVIFNHARLYPGAPLTQKLIRSGQLDPELDLLYPVYHNPAPFNHLLHRFEAKCHLAGVASRLGLYRGEEIA